MKNFFEELSNNYDLPVMPSVAVKIMDLLEQDEVNTDEFIKAISVDPSLTSKILKAANSPVYGLVSQVNSISHALNLLGLKRTMQLALTFSLTETLNQKYPRELDYQYFWERSIIAGTAARLLAGNSEDSEPLFLAALLQDIGVFILAKALGHQYLNTVSKIQRNHTLLYETEIKTFQYSHSEVGAWILRSWSLPEKIELAVLNSHNVNVNLSHFSACVAVSGWVADYWLVDHSEQEHQELFIKGLIQKTLKMSSQDIDTFMQKILDNLPEVAMWFNDHELRALNDRKRNDILLKAAELQVIFAD